MGVNPAGITFNGLQSSWNGGSVAQLNRASDYGSEGCGFESRRNHEDENDHPPKVVIFLSRKENSKMAFDTRFNMYQKVYKALRISIVS